MSVIDKMRIHKLMLHKEKLFNTSYINNIHYVKFTKKNLETQESILNPNE